jgi:hypothetical protein
MTRAWTRFSLAHCLQNAKKWKQGYINHSQQYGNKSDSLFQVELTIDQQDGNKSSLETGLDFRRPLEDAPPFNQQYDLSK